MSAEPWPYDVPAATFLQVPEADHLNALLKSDGFALAPRCRPRQRHGTLHVALVWTRKYDDMECVLRLRVRMPLAPADGARVRPEAVRG